MAIRNIAWCPGDTLSSVHLVGPYLGLIRRLISDGEGYFRGKQTEGVRLKNPEAAFDLASIAHRIDSGLASTRPIG